MDDERITEIEARRSATTEGQWVVRDHYGPSGVASAIYRDIAEIGIDGMFKGDAEFIAHSRADVDYLIFEVKRLREVVEHYASHENWTNQGGLREQNIDLEDIYMFDQPGYYRAEEAFLPLAHWRLK